MDVTEQISPVIRGQVLGSAEEIAEFFRDFRYAPSRDSDKLVPYVEIPAQAYSAFQERQKGNPPLNCLELLAGGEKLLLVVKNNDGRLGGVSVSGAHLFTQENDGAREVIEEVAKEKEVGITKVKDKVTFYNTSQIRNYGDLVSGIDSVLLAQKAAGQRISELEKRTKKVEAVEPQYRPPREPEKVETPAAPERRPETVKEDRPARKVPYTTREVEDPDFGSVTESQYIYSAMLEGDNPLHIAAHVNVYWHGNKIVRHKADIQKEFKRVQREVDKFFAEERKRLKSKK